MPTAIAPGRPLADEATARDVSPTTPPCRRRVADTSRREPRGPPGGL